MEKQGLPQLVEGVDYYWEGDKMIFTAHYLANRGYCCQLGCRHCPFGVGPKGREEKMQGKPKQNGRT